MSEPTERVYVVDPKLKEYATKIQADHVDAVNKYGSNQKAAKHLGMNRRSIDRALTKLKENATRKGYAPGHFDQGVAPGNMMGKVTVQRDGQGNVVQTWERQHEEGKNLELIVERIEEAATGLKPLKPIKAPKKTNADLLTLYTITDFHVGMYAWAPEAGEDWDSQIAMNVMCNAIDEMIEGSPDSEEALLNQLGDFMHWDGLDAMTPTSHNVLDADSRFDLMVDISIQLIRYAIQQMLKKHKRVRVFMCEGNHDLAGSVWLRKCMKYLYIKNKRVIVDDTSFPFYAYLHGDIMLGFHHGHKVNNAKLARLFSCEPRYRAMWGQAKYAFIHSGHLHHTDTDEGGGAIVERHPTLAAADAYAARGGWVSWRAAKAITYHKKTGEHSRKVVHPNNDVNEEFRS